MSYEHILYERQGRVATITLNRPDRLNAIASGMPREIAAAVERANEDDGVHVIVLTGAGRAFCAGYDLKDFAEAPAGNRGTGAASGDARSWDPM
ncbi:MAG: enoyl-CoA hydratase-related protein, partial [Parvibaculum sp.]